MFLATLNLPISDGEEFLVAVEKIFKAFAGREVAEAGRAVEWMEGCFGRAIDLPAEEPQDTENDFTSRMLVSSLDGIPISRQQMITICLTPTTAGLDTTRSALGFIFHHLAQDDGTRRRLGAGPELWPKAVEEFIRLYPLVYQDGRLVKQDIDFHGLQLRSG